jgi:hypothetical protein
LPSSAHLINLARETFTNLKRHSKEFFPGISKIQYKGPKSKIPLALKCYNADEVVEGKTMNEPCASRQPLLVGADSVVSTRLTSNAIWRASQLGMEAGVHVYSWRRQPFAGEAVAGASWPLPEGVPTCSRSLRMHLVVRFG